MLGAREKPVPSIGCCLTLPSKGTDAKSIVSGCENPCRTVAEILRSQNRIGIVVFQAYVHHVLRSVILSISKRIERRPLFALYYICLIREHPITHNFQSELVVIGERGRVPTRN